MIVGFDGEVEVAFCCWWREEIEVVLFVHIEGVVPGVLIAVLVKHVGYVERFEAARVFGKS